MNPALYGKVFLYSVILMSIFSTISLRNKGFNDIRKNNHVALLFAFIISIIFALWIGGRPTDSHYFGDTVNYARTYYRMADQIYTPAEINSDKYWVEFMYWCAQRMDISSYFTIISIGYFGFTLWACKRFTSNNPLICLLFIMGAFSFYTYGCNGIRNGLACAITLVSISYLVGSKLEILIGCILAFFAIHIHKTTMLPIGMAIISILLVRKFKWALVFWVLSIFISLIAGNIISNYFGALGFDDRLTYLVTDQDEGVFSHSGFRWDFLLYSFMPILLGYYIVIKRDIQDRTFNFLLNTYTLANAFWVMVIRANYSNRFAYLSWFMYPLVLAYPLLKVDVWGEIQGKRLQQIMLAQVGFTWLMETFVWK